MRFLLRRDYPRIPPGGHRFVDVGVELRGTSIDDVIAKIIAHRANRGKPLGDPEDELAEFYHTLAPEFVRADMMPAIRTRSDRVLVSETIMRAWSERLPLLPSNEHLTIDSRLGVCEKCRFRLRFIEPENVYTRVASARGAALTGNINIDAAGYCSHYFWPISLGARLAHPETLALKPAPKECWMPGNEYSDGRDPGCF